MKTNFSTTKSILLAVAFAAALSACGGGAAQVPPSSAVVAPLSPTSFTELTPQMTALIESRYSSSPDLKRAAEGYATNLLKKWGAAQATGRYDEALSLRSVNALSCLIARERLLGQDFSEKDLSRFLAAMTPTPELFKAYIQEDTLSSGHPESIHIDEADACPAAGIQ